MTSWIIQWTIPSLLHKSIRKNSLVYLRVLLISIFNSKVCITCIWWNTKSCEFRAAVTHWIVFTANHASFMLKAHLLWKVSMKSIFSKKYWMGKTSSPCDMYFYGLEWIGIWANQKMCIYRLYYNVDYHPYGSNMIAVPQNKYRIQST